MTHERTSTGRKFFSLHRRLKNLAERNRAISVPTDIEVVDRLQIELYGAACNGATERHYQVLEAVNQLFLRR